MWTPKFPHVEPESYMQGFGYSMWGSTCRIWVTGDSTVLFCDFMWVYMQDLMILHVGFEIPQTDPTRRTPHAGPHMQLRNNIVESLKSYMQDAYMQNTHMWGFQNYMWQAFRVGFRLTGTIYWIITLCKMCSTWEISREIMKMCSMFILQYISYSGTS